MALAERRGEDEVVELMLRLGATNYNRSLASAAEGGHALLAKLMLDLGARDLNTAQRIAASGGHAEVVSLLLERGATNYKLLTILAAHRGHSQERHRWDVSPWNLRSQSGNAICYQRWSAGDSEVNAQPRMHSGDGALR